MTPIQQKSTAASPTRAKPGGVRRLVSAVVLGLGVISGITSTAVFATWADLNDDIYFRAVEIGQQGTFPPGHFAYGWFTAATTTVFVAAAICAGWVLFKPRLEFDRPWKVIWLGAAAFITGAGVPAVIHYYLLGAPLVIFGLIGLVGFALAARQGNVSRT